MTAHVTPTSGASWTSADEIAWHEIECGHYTADLPLWRKLAAASPGPVLDIGAGTGRVTLDLARGGHQVVAVDLARALIDELGRRAAGLPVTTVVADARALPDLPADPPGLCLVPMQTTQLLGGVDGRSRFFSSLRRKLAPGALVALAIGEELDVFESRPGGYLPPPDRGSFGGTSYVSRPTAVREREDCWVLEREREATDAHGTRSAPDVILLDRVTRLSLEREAAAHGFAAERPRVIPETDEHVASTVVVLHA